MDGELVRIVDGEIVYSSGGNPKILKLPEMPGEGPAKALDLAMILWIVKVVMSLLAGLGVIPNIPLPGLPGEPTVPASTEPPAAEPVIAA